MIITKVVIENFKSIDKLEIPFDKVGDSYTKIFVGVNESGKSNILEALSYFDEPKEQVSYEHFCNQKLDDEKSSNVFFFLDFENNEEKDLKKYINSFVNTECNVQFIIKNVRKNVYLTSNSSQFHHIYFYDVEINDTFFIKQSRVPGKSKIIIVDAEHKDSTYEKLSTSNFRDYFNDIITDFFKKKEPRVSVWKPASKEMLYNVNLLSIKNNISSNKALYNVFKLGGYEGESVIGNVIDRVTNPSSRSKLASKLTVSLNEYISRVWNNNMDLIIDITETGNFSLLIKDKGEDNIHDRFSISDRSQGAQHFLSIILSLSLAANNHDRKNELILIDEPEVHLHPSGIRDLSKELLKIGQDNYVFLATHSPFMIDKRHKERHFIVKKNRKAISEVKRIKDSDNIIDDEVLRDAFGMDVYKDLLNPHSVLVEGSSDKIIIQKALDCLGEKNIGITNGHGSNITTLVSKLNYEDLSVLVVLDDDEDGRKDKEKILKVGGLYSINNVFTIRDLVSEVVDNGTIEDTLDQSFVKSQFKKFYKSKYNKDAEIEILATRPVIVQIIEFLKQEKHYSQWDMDAFKKQLSEEFSPNKTSISSSNPLLKKLAENIVQKLQLN